MEKTSTNPESPAAAEAVTPAATESISVSSAKSQWARVVREARKGKKFKLTQGGKVVLELVPVVAPPKPKAAKPRDVKWGDLKGKIWMAPDFNEPLDDMKEYM